MAKNVFDTLKERGFIAQCSHEDELRELLGKEKITFYTGYDATADSLHVGHFLQAIAMRHMQMAGHRPLVLIGGGTTLIGDPSGRTDMRKMLGKDDIAHNGNKFIEQLSRFIDFSDGKAILENNANWLPDLKYIPFLREIGTDFSVNRMLTAECFKSRMEKGLSFFEFNYMIMQAYDFLVLNEKYDCVLECGGDDQWSNILAGADLIRRKKQKKAYALTFNLLTNSSGVKMGKTVSGALWLDKDKTSPYEFFQYWRNIEDESVKKCLLLLTFLPVEEIEDLTKTMDASINKAKEVLAYEVTKLVHGQEEADKALQSSREIFSIGVSSANAPTTEFDKDVMKEGLKLTKVLVETGLTSSASQGRTLIQQGGITVGDEKVTDFNFVVNDTMFDKDGILMIKKGKKTFHQLKLK